MPSLRRHRRLPDSLRAKPRLESLELRSVLSAVFEAEPNNTLDLANLLGDPLAGSVSVLGSIESGSDVDWYSFTLGTPARVTLSTSGSKFAGTLGLYNTDPWSFSDPDGAAGHRLLAQTVSGIVQRDLPAGTYFAAMSAAGNRDFHPFLEDSGGMGEPGDYGLEVAAFALATPAGPTVLASDPAPDAALASAPLVLRVSLTGQLDPNTVFAGNTVALFGSVSGTFTPEDSIPINLAWVNFSAEATELQLAPAAALPPGKYQIRLNGDTTAGFAFLADPSGVPFGSDIDHPNGQVATIAFSVTGIEGGAEGRDLGDLTLSGMARAEGAIGDDSFYDPYGPDPLATNPAADVDLYRFHVGGPGLFAFSAEVFAGRIGSRLDPGASLFRVDPADGRLQLIAANDNTLNGTPTTNGMLPLLTDSALFAGLTEGDYVVAVTSRGNAPDPLLGLSPGVDGVFDPNLPHSGTAGSSVGRYVLDLSLRPAADPPEVAFANLAEGDALDAAPTGLDVQFTTAVNLQKLAFEAFNQPVPGEIRSVFIRGEYGDYFPRLTAYDCATNTASFLMLDRLPNGSYELHLSGALGLTDFADQGLIGNDPSGDFVVRFTVNDPLPVALAQTWTDPVQSLGILFPYEAQAGVVVNRTEGVSASTTDDYVFEVLQQKTYAITLDATELPAGFGLFVLDADGNPVEHATTVDTGDAIQASLDPGTYIVRITGLPEDMTGLSYRLRIQLLDSPDNPSPLTTGPFPVSMTNLVTIQSAFLRVIPGLEPTAGSLANLASPAPAPTADPIPPSPGTGGTRLSINSVAEVRPSSSILPPGLTSFPTADNGVLARIASFTTTDLNAAGDSAPTAVSNPIFGMLVVCLPAMEIAPFPSEVAPAADPEPALPPREVSIVLPPPFIAAGLQAGPVGGIAPEAAMELKPLVETKTSVVVEARSVEAESETPVGIAHWWPTATVLLTIGVGAGLHRVRRRWSGMAVAELDCSRAGAPDVLAH